MTMWQIVLRTAAALPGSWSEWDLTVAMFARYPERCAMRGHPAHPDHKLTYVALLSCIKRGYIERCGTSRFRLSPAGGLAVARMNEAAA